MKITYQKIVEFNNSAREWLKKAPENRNTKLGYAIAKNLKQTDKLLKPVFELDENLTIEIQDINSDNALTDPTTKAFIYDIIKGKEGEDVQRYKYTPETRKKRDNEIREAVKRHSATVEKLLEKEVEFEPYFATEIPLLTFEEKEAFEIIIKNG